MNAARSRASGSRSTSRSDLIGAGGQATGPSSGMAGNLPHDRRAGAADDRPKNCRHRPVFTVADQTERSRSSRDSCRDPVKMSHGPPSCHLRCHLCRYLSSAVLGLSEAGRLSVMVPRRWPFSVDLSTVAVGVCRLSCPVTSKIPRRASLTCEEESVLSIFGRQRVRFARFIGRKAATRDNEVCLSGRLGDRFGRFPGCMNVSASRPSAAGRGKLSGRRRRSSTTNWQKGKFDVTGHQLT
jgi:hypothetical protein